jgi:hypothetical protein
MQELLYHQFGISDTSILASLKHPKEKLKNETLGYGGCAHRAGFR